MADIIAYYKNPCHDDDSGNLVAPCPGDLWVVEATDKKGLKWPYVCARVRHTAKALHPLFGLFSTDPPHRSYLER